MSFETGLRILIDPTGARTGGAAVRRELDHIGREARQTEREMTGAFDRARTALFAFQGALGGLGVGLAISRFTKLADTANNLEAQLRLVTNSSEQLARVQERLFSIAQDTRTGFESTVQVFARMARASEELGISQERLLAVTKTINQSLLVSGASAESANAALVQLAQGLASGALRGEELNSVLEQAPRLARALADGLGVGIGELRRLGEEGELTARRVVGAFEDQADAVAREVSRIDRTVSQAMTNLENDILRLVGVMDDGTGATEDLVRVIDELRRVIVDPDFQTAITTIAGGFTVLAREVGDAVKSFGQLVDLVSNFSFTDLGEFLNNVGILGLYRDTYHQMRNVDLFGEAPSVSPPPGIGPTPLHPDSGDPLRLEINRGRRAVGGGGGSAGSAANDAAQSFDTARQALDLYKGSVAEHIGQLRTETELLRLSSDEREVQRAIMEAQNVAMSRGNLLTGEQIENIREQVEAQQELRRAAEEALDRQQEAERAAADRRREAERQAERQRDIFLEPIKNAVRGIQDAFTGMFKSVFSGGVDSFKDLGREVLDIFTTLAAQIASLLVFRPVANIALGAFGLGGLSQQLGFGGAGAGTGGTGIGDLLGLGRSLAGNSLFGGVGSFLNNSIGTSLGFASTTGTGIAAAGLPTAGAPGFIGPSSAGTGLFGSTTFTSFLGGAGLGFGAGSLLNNLLGGNPMGGTIGSGVGGLAGAAIGSIIPGVGTVLGGLLGGLFGGGIGGLFGGKPKKPRAQLLTAASPTGIGPLEDEGFEEGLFERTPFGFVGFSANTTRKLDHALNGMLETVTQFDRAAAAVLSDQSEVAAVGRHLQTTQAVSDKSAEFDEHDFGDLVEDRAVNILRALGVSGRLQERVQFAENDIAETTKRTIGLLQERRGLKALIDDLGELDAITNAAANEARALGETISQLGQSTDDYGFSAEKVAETQRRLVEEFLGIGEATEAMSDAEAALAALNARFEEAADLARRVGISQAELNAGREQALEDLASGFNDANRRAILGITDPLQLALEDFERVAEQRLEDARALGAETVLVERRNALERQQIVERFAQSASRSLGPLERLLNDLTTSPNSPLPREQVLGAAEARFNALRAQALSGDTSVHGQLATASQNYLDLARGQFASSEAFFDIFDRVTGTLRNLTGAGANGGQANLQALHTIGGRIGEGNEELRGIRSELKLTRQENARLRTDIERLLSRAA